MMQHNSEPTGSLYPFRKNCTASGVFWVEQFMNDPCLHGFLDIRLLLAKVRQDLRELLAKSARVCPWEVKRLSYI